MEILKINLKRGFKPSFVYVRADDLDKADRLKRDLIKICKNNGEYHATDRDGRPTDNPRLVHRSNLSQ